MVGYAIWSKSSYGKSAEDLGIGADLLSRYDGIEDEGRGSTK